MIEFAVGCCESESVGVDEFARQSWINVERL